MYGAGSRQENKTKIDKLLMDLVPLVRLQEKKATHAAAIYFDKNLSRVKDGLDVYALRTEIKREMIGFIRVEIFSPLHFYSILLRDPFRVLNVSFGLCSFIKIKFCLLNIIHDFTRTKLRHK